MGGLLPRGLVPWAADTPLPAAAFLPPRALFPLGVCAAAGRAKERPEATYPFSPQRRLPNTTRARPAASQAPPTVIHTRISKKLLWLANWQQKTRSEQKSTCFKSRPIHGNGRRDVQSQTTKAPPTHTHTHQITIGAGMARSPAALEK